MLTNYSHSFETKNGLLVHVPTAEGRQFGEFVIQQVLKNWRPPSYFFHFKCGGHVAAARYHVGSTVFAHLDIQSFFASVTRSKLTRALRSLGMSNADAFEIATQSTVTKPSPGHGRSLPFGFVQSPVLASLALDRSALGGCLRTGRPGHIKLSVYVDDIIISGSDEVHVRAYVEQIERAASLSRYTLSRAKSRVAVSSVKAFNLDLSCSDLRVTPERMDAFSQIERTPDQAKERAIVSYVASVNPGQAEWLSTSLGLAPLA